eukprot:CAMPEP_0176057682 /NCGR_PEP_ID=MMETSP0120_2-20121206/28732_1 /TAXON_ID=160619 /ORGANISM="Kryptoperidinium foliaceum, Strain CCMP 1326" /LENGTH=43 /DNA_ID= /DNA_START= /DNA_END= /DNA_ORIENTATION=
MAEEAGARQLNLQVGSSETDAAAREGLLSKTAATSAVAKFSNQ